MNNVGFNIIKHLIQGDLEQNLCRVCLTDVDENTNIHSYEESTKMRFSHMIEIAASIKIEEQDGLPQFLCPKCCSEVLITYGFLLKVQNTEAMLKSTVEHMFDKFKHLKKFGEQIYVKKEEIDNTKCQLTVQTQTLDKSVAVLSIKQIPESFITNYRDLGSGNIKVDLNLNVDTVESFDDDDVIVIVKEDSQNANTTKYDQIATLSNMKKNSLDENTSTSFRSDNEINKKSLNNLNNRPITKRSQRKNNQVMLQIFECNVCKIECVSSKDLTSHLKEHKEYPLKCSKCLLAFKTVSTYNQHNEQHHTKTRKFICDVCGKVVHTAHRLARHKADGNCHVKAYICDYCGKVYKGKVAFEVHILQHQCENNDLSMEKAKDVLFCEHCGEKFIAQYLLKSHVAVKHNSEKPYSCEICYTRHRTKFALKSHMAMHTGEGRVHCQVCGRSVVNKRKLASHMWTHTNERPFVCHLCGRGFASLGHVNTHYKVAHTKPTIPCPESGCTALFHLKSRLNYHYKEVHLKQNKRRRNVKRKYIESDLSGYYTHDPCSLQNEKPLSFTTVNASHLINSFDALVLQKLHSIEK